MKCSVILYYNFVSIPNPKQFCADHKRKCEQLNLMGRVYIASEGINGTLAGTQEEIEEYKNFLCHCPGFEKTEFKQDLCEEIPFIKLIVKTRSEIVALKTGKILNPKSHGGKHLSPKQWRDTLESDEEYVLLDIRNDYETKIGHFEGAVTPDLENFYDFPQWLQQQNYDKNKKVLMYCTGGIRCEKFSVLMREEGYKDVNQLHGGIIEYAKQEGGKHFKGKCFVFDDRLVVDVGSDEHVPLGRCEISGEACDQYLNCANPDCNRLFLCIKEAAIEMDGCCSEDCRKSPRKRPLDANDVYAPSRKWYHYFDEKPK